MGAMDDLALEELWNTWGSSLFLDQVALFVVSVGGGGGSVHF